MTRDEYIARSLKSIQPENGMDLCHNIFFHALALEVAPNYVSDPADRYRVEQDFAALFTLCKGGNIGRKFLESQFAKDNKVEIMALYSLGTSTKMGDASSGQIGDWLFLAMFFRGCRAPLPEKYKAFLDKCEAECVAWLIGKMTAPHVWEKLKKVRSFDNLTSVYAQRYLGSSFSKYESLVTQDLEKVRKLFYGLESDHRRFASNVPMNWVLQYH